MLWFPFSSSHQFVRMLIAPQVAAREAAVASLSLAGAAGGGGDEGEGESMRLVVDLPLFPHAVGGQWQISLILCSCPR